MCSSRSRAQRAVIARARDERRTRVGHLDGELGFDHVAVRLADRRGVRIGRRRVPQQRARRRDQRLAGARAGGREARLSLVLALEPRRGVLKLRQRKPRAQPRRALAEALRLAEQVGAAARGGAP